MADEHPLMTPKALNIGALVVLGVLVTGGIGAEQYMLHVDKDPGELTRPDLQKSHLVNLRPDTEEVLPEKFIDSIAYCSESTFEHYTDSPFQNEAGYSCSPWRTAEEDNNEVPTFHYPRMVVVGDQAAKVHENIPTQDDDFYQTEELRPAADGAPEILFRGYRSEDPPSGAGDVFVYYPDEKIIIGWPWSLDDEGVNSRFPLEIAEDAGF